MSLQEIDGRSKSTLSANTRCSVTSDALLLRALFMDPRRLCNVCWMEVYEIKQTRSLRIAYGVSV